MMAPSTPKALNSKAQCRVAHAGLPIIPNTEPQRGSTKDAPPRLPLCVLCDLGEILLRIGAPSIDLVDVVGRVLVNVVIEPVTVEEV